MKVKDSKDNFLIILIIVFGVFFGFVLTVASILTYFLYYKTKQKKNEDLESNGIEDLKCTNEIPNTNLQKNNSRKFPNIFPYRNAVHKKSQKKNVLSKVQTSELGKTKTTLSHKFKCQNNNTACSNFLKAVQSTFKFNNSSMKDSLLETSSTNESSFTFSHINHRKFKKRFKPLCTSSPILPPTSKSSHNTFNFNHSFLNAGHNTDSELSSLENQTINRTNSCLNLSKEHNDRTESLSNLSDHISESLNEISPQIYCNIKEENNSLNSQYFNPRLNTKYNTQPIHCIRHSSALGDMEQNLFDPKYVCSETDLIENYHVFGMFLHDVIPSCCRKPLKLSKKLSSSHELLKKTFNNASSDLKFCNFLQESLEERIIINIECSYNEVTFNACVNVFYVSTGIYQTILFIRNSFYPNISKYSFEMENSINNLNINAITTFHSEVIQNNRFDRSMSFGDTHQNELSTTDDFQFPNNSDSISESSFTQHEINYLHKISFGDASWRGRSRKAKNKNQNF